MEHVIDDLVDWLRARVEEAGSKGIIFGLSGGIDSAVMAGLAKKSFPDSSLGLIMPCHSIEEDEAHGRLVAEALDLDIIKVDLSSTFDSFMEAAENKEETLLARSNVKPRLRMTSLYYYAQSLGYLVAGPTNRSEYVTGYFTKHGDSAVDILPLASFTKREIYEMAKLLDIPQEIIDKTPSAGLWKDQSDEEEMGFSYDVLEKYINGEEIDKDLYDKISKMDNRSQHKRQYPPIYRYNQ